MDFAAGKEALRLFDATLAEGRSLSLETTLTGHSVLGRMRLARDAGYHVTLRYVAVTDARVNIDRVQARAAAGGHWIDPDTIRRRVEGSLQNLAAAVALAHETVLIDNSGAVHRRVFSVQRGVVVQSAPDLPAWLTQRMPAITAELERAARQSRPD